MKKALVVGINHYPKASNLYGCMEEEWRIIRNMRGNYIGAQQFADIISAIYLDYSILNKRKTKQIIHLAKENGWNIFVRYFDELNAEYRYDTIKNIGVLISNKKHVIT